MKIVYYSITGQTRRLITKLDKFTLDDSIEITANNPELDIIEDYVLIVPSYAENHNGICKSQEVMDPVFEFMDYNDNYQRCKGIIGTGNRNFAELFGYTAIELKEKYGTEILYLAEFSGMPEDITEINEILDRMSK